MLTTAETILTPRVNVKPYNVQMNETSLDILKLVFEFKIATAWQITRFLKQRDRVKYIYLKLHRMWQAGLLESFKVFTGSRAGMPVYYMLSKSGLKVLGEYGHYDKDALKNYPPIRALLSSGMFKHEAQVVELASQEILNKTSDLHITFTGETKSQTREYRSDKHIEVLTPDYTAFYTVGNQTERIFTEFERTNKTHVAMLKKIDRYIKHLTPDGFKNTTLRLIFQTSGMETAFWRNLCLEKPQFNQHIRILTTHLSLLGNRERFSEAIYASFNTIGLVREGRVFAKVESRIKLFSFL
ncbi:MAG: hypothetical protein A2817_01735 [Candidatus Yanofskybacteria bacterium RIFCSPHIGHO2_01_FULL_39_8b]|uniref:Uncharacterized protein n=1 Tax=Candidatus Yanofskybacteria bacterium RIFCSPHIGHO2_01_FULL_39_8b TaxID=1802659 RepID=A0A1F8EAU7_9BACT|nr:MAG: hypothetical protein A2817_01735 [Candidatus Yanofskybacteria bacterium RIFCSPHIGHO2_01_FULL_39_8b]